MNINQLLRYVHRDNFLPNGKLRRRYPDLDNIPADQAKLIEAVRYPMPFSSHGPALQTIADKIGMKKAANALACIQTCIKLGLVEVYIRKGQQWVGATDA